MNKQEYKSRYRALRIKLKNNPSYKPTTEVEYDLYNIWLHTHLTTLNQLFTGMYGKPLLLFSTEMLTNPYKGIYTQTEYYSDGTTKTYSVPKGKIIFPSRLG